MILTVIEKDGRGDLAAYDIYSRLLKDRIIFLGEAITDEVASSIIAQFLHLSNSSSKKIDFYLMTPGGDVAPGFAIYDTMQYIKNDVATYCVGQAASMGAFLLAAGTKGQRFALPSTRIMLHQPWGSGAASDARDFEILSQEINKMKLLLYKRLSKHTGQTVDRLAEDCDRDFYMSAKEAMEYGIIDSVLVERNS